MAAPPVDLGGDMSSSPAPPSPSPSSSSSTDSTTTSGDGVGTPTPASSTTPGIGDGAATSSTTTTTDVSESTTTFSTSTSTLQTSSSESLTPTLLPSTLASTNNTTSSISSTTISTSKISDLSSTSTGTNTTTTTTMTTTTISHEIISASAFIPPKQQHHTAKSNHHRGAIIGGTIGGIAFLCAVVLAVLFFLRKHRRRRHSFQDPNGQRKGKVEVMQYTSLNSSFAGVPFTSSKRAGPPLPRLKVMVTPSSDGEREKEGEREEGRLLNGTPLPSPLLSPGMLHDGYLGGQNGGSVVIGDKDNDELEEKDILPLNPTDKVVHAKSENEPSLKPSFKRHSTSDTMGFPLSLPPPPTTAAGSPRSSQNESFPRLDILAAAEREREREREAILSPTTSFDGHRHRQSRPRDLLLTKGRTPSRDASGSGAASPISPVSPLHTPRPTTGTSISMRHISPTYSLYPSTSPPGSPPPGSSATATARHRRLGAVTSFWDVAREAEAEAEASTQHSRSATSSMAMATPGPARTSIRSHSDDRSTIINQQHHPAVLQRLSSQRSNHTARTMSSASVYSVQSDATLGAQGRFGNGSGNGR